MNIIQKKWLYKGKKNRTILWKEVCLIQRRKWATIWKWVKIKPAIETESSNFDSGLYQMNISYQIIKMNMVQMKRNIICYVMFISIQRKNYKTNVFFIIFFFWLTSQSSQNVNECWSKLDNLGLKFVIIPFL